MQLNSVDISYFKQQQLFSAWNTEINWLIGDYLGGKGKWTTLGNSSAN
jgi:hypothetical protein